MEKLEGYEGTELKSIVDATIEKRWNKDARQAVESFCRGDEKKLKTATTTYFMGLTDGIGLVMDTIKSLIDETAQASTDAEKAEKLLKALLKAGIFMRDAHICAYDRAVKLMVEEIHGQTPAENAEMFAKLKTAIKIEDDPSATRH